MKSKLCFYKEITSESTVNKDEKALRVKEGNMSENIIVKVEDLTMAYHDKPVLWDNDVSIIATPGQQLSALMGR